MKDLKLKTKIYLFFCSLVWNIKFMFHQSASLIIKPSSFHMEIVPVFIDKDIVHTFTTFYILHKEIAITIGIKLRAVLLI